MTDEEFFRHVPTRHIENDLPSPKAFQPRASDQGLLSVNRSTLTTACDSHLLFTTPKPDGFSGKSEGDWAVTVEEVIGCTLTSRPDPIEADPAQETPANLAHAVVDFTEAIDTSDAARRLRAFAVARGRRHPPP